MSIDSDTPPFDDSFYDAVVNELYGLGGYSPDYLTSPNGSALIEETNRVLMDGVDKGVASITEEPDPAFSAALAQNTFIFSGFKTHQELQEVNSLLRDKDGKLRPYDEFKRDVDKLGKEYNQNYLRAEYNHAVQSAQMAAKWQEFQKHKDFVNLQYRTANDERVRAEHAALHGTTLPVDDKFWTKYLPPLGWNCRCTVVEVLKDSYPESNSDEAVRAGDSATSRPAEKIFRFNPGKELKVFPPKHPYLPKGCGDCKRGVGAKNLAWDPNNPSCQACKAIEVCVNGKLGSKGFSVEEKIAIYQKPINQQFVQEIFGEGAIKEHILMCKTDQDYPKVRSVAEAFATEGHTAVLNPIVDKNEKFGRKKIYPEFSDDFIGNPDLYIAEYGYIDVKTPKKTTNVVGLAFHASEVQKSIACITDLRFKAITQNQIDDRNKEIFRKKDRYPFDIIFWYIGGKLYKYRRSDY